MNKASKKFLYDLLKTPSPTGYEEKIQKVVKKRMSNYASVIETDLHGNLIVGINTKASRNVMLAGHCDQIGFMVRHISDKGYIYVASLGGIDTGVLPGAHVTIDGKRGRVQGVIGRKPIHLQKTEERGKAKVEIEKVWIDIGAANKKEAEKLVEIGDPVVFEPRITELLNGFICAPGLDDRVGLFVAMETLRICAASKLNVALYSVSTVQEEVGLRGAKTSAFGVDPEVGIGIDVTHSSDQPGQDDSKAAPCELSKGPGIYRGPSVNPVVYRKLVQTAKTRKIPYQILPAARPLPNDTSAIQTTRAGVASASIGVPNRYMHTQVEVCSLKDLELCSKLIAEFVKGITARTDFRPR